MLAGSKARMRARKHTRPDYGTHAQNAGQARAAFGIVGWDKGDVVVISDVPPWSADALTANVS